MRVASSEWLQVHVWDYNTRKSVASVDSGHSANIFCTRFMPQTGDEVVASAAGDCEVRGREQFPLQSRSFLPFFFDGIPSSR